MPLFSYCTTLSAAWPFRATNSSTSTRRRAEHFPEQTIKVSFWSVRSLILQCRQHFTRSGIAIPPPARTRGCTTSPILRRVSQLSQWAVSTLTTHLASADGSSRSGERQLKICRATMDAMAFNISTRQAIDKLQHLESPVRGIFDISWS